MKTKLAKIMIIGAILLVLGFGLVYSSVNASSVYDKQVPSLALTNDIEYSLEEMLNYAIQDEYLAKAEYELIISEYGEIKPFINIVQAEQQHIDLLVPLFEAYGYVIPENNALESVVLPESITSAIATGVDAEKTNIAMYQVFLSQDNLPDDVRTVFEYLMKASERHLEVFSKDRFSFTVKDMMNQFQKGIGNMFKKGQESQGQQGGSKQGSNGQLTTNQQNKSGECL